MSNRFERTTVMSTYVLSAASSKCSSQPYCGLSCYAFLEHCMFNRLSFPETFDTDRKIHKLGFHRFSSDFWHNSRCSFQGRLKAQTISGTSLFLLSLSNAVDAILDVSSICLLLGGQFHLVADDDFYRTYAIKSSAEGYMISIQFEDIRYGTVNIILLLLDSSLC